MPAAPPPERFGPGSADSGGTGWAAGPVTRLGMPAPAGVPGPSQPPPDPRRPDRRLWWFAGAAGAVLVTGLVVVLALVLSGNPDPFGVDRVAPAVDVRPPLARMCPPPTATPSTAQPPTTPRATSPSATPQSGSARPGDPAPSGPRTVDEEAGISYRKYGPPWQPWNTVWRAGTLGVPYRVGQHFITESAYDGISDYHASILSAAVPAADNDAFTLNIECIGRQVAADVRAEYYPQPNQMDLLRDERTTLDGRPAWVTAFRLHFRQEGLRATDELVAVACIDVGRLTAAVLYVSIPGTHRQYDWIVDDVIASVRTT